MKCLKTISLAAVAAMALMAFAASSTSATALYTGETKLGVGAELDFSLKSGTSASLVEKSAPEGEGKTLDTCKSSTVKGSITNAGGASATVSGNIADEVKEGKTITGLTWGSCTFPTTTTIPGSFEAHQIGSTTNATLTASATMGMTMNTLFFGSCVWGVTKGDDLGELTTDSSGTPTEHLHAVLELLSGSNIACPSTSVWTATYVSTTPDNLRVETS